MKLLLFDIDGTLVSTGGAGVRALNRAFQQVLLVENAMEGIRPHGKTDPAIIREIFDSRRDLDPTVCSSKDILSAYLEYLADEVQTSKTYRVMPGIEHFLADYSHRPDISCGLATGNIEKGARIKLERGNLNRFFSFGGFGSDSEERSVLVRRAAERAAQECQISALPNDTFVIGDTPRDVQAGREAGFRTVGVATSTFSVAELEASGADVVLRDFQQDRDQFLRLTRIE